jgi:NAD-dependent SIR2 family protein deacetylase
MDGAGRTAVAGLREAAGLLGAARRVVVFSGAGISTDSRIIV